MSNLRSDCLDLVKDREAGDVWRSHIERLCHQIDLLEKSWQGSNRRLASIRETLETAVCTVEPDKGVILLSDHGSTHTEIINGKTFANVYDHQYFSPLGDALIAAWEKAKTVGCPIEETP
jgi:hypothetical protein